MKEMDNARLLPLVEMCQQQSVGWQRAFDEIAELMSPLLKAAVSRRRSYAHHADDLAQAALMGLWEAVLRYSPDHPSGKTFAVVAQYRINYAVENYLAEMGGAVSVPKSHGFNEMGKILRALEEYGKEHQVERPEAHLSPEELDDLTGVRGSHSLLNAVGRSIGSGSFSSDGADEDYEGGTLSLDSPAWGVVSGAEDALMEALDDEEARDFLETAYRMMELPDDPEARAALADEVVARWGRGPEESARLRRAVSNRLRKHRGEQLPTSIG